MFLDEAIHLGDRMLWLQGGAVRGHGPLPDVMAAPEFVRWRRDDAGVVVVATVAEHRSEDHLSRLEGPWGDVWVRRQDHPVGASVRLRVLARDVSLALSFETESTLLNQFPARIVGLEADGEGGVTVRLAPRGASDSVLPLVARITLRSARHLSLEPGSEVWARVKAVAVLA